MSSSLHSELDPSAPAGDARTGQEADLPANESSGPAPDVYSVDLDEELIDADAAKVVRRLTRHGYEAYLVGGGVRDLLVGRRPKDFDIATSARPDDVRRLFRNSRIIGRRFRLVHVLFGGGKVIETATFRRAPEDATGRDGDDLLIRNDNVFGDAHEDAQRRDFRINGLFYDIERQEVIDWVGGMPDIDRRSVHTIGNPVVRFLEDPVRILRAIKFSARLDFGISPDVYDAIVTCRHALRRAAKPRLFEEVLRLMREGAAHRAIWIAWETGVLDVLLPELSTFLADREESDDVVWRLLSELDRRIENGAGPDDTLLWAALLLEPMREACLGERDRVDAAHDFLEPIVDRLNVPRRIADPVRRVIAALPRLESGRAGRFARSGLYALASEISALRASCLEGAPIAAPPTLEPDDAGSAGGRRRRRRKRRTRVEA
jgi:poly(A) polymerase